MEDPEGGPQERYVACGLALGRPCTVLKWAVKHLGLRGGAPKSLNLHTATPKKSSLDLVNNCDNKHRNFEDNAISCNSH